MKRIITGILILASFNASFAQIITAKELINKAECKSFECFNDFITLKGYSFEKSNSAGTTHAYVYLGDDNYATQGVSTRDVSIYTIAEKLFVSVVFRTADKKKYQSVLAEIKSLGFMGGEATNTENGTIVLYTSEKYKKYTIGVLIDKLTKDNLRWTSYHFEITKRN